MKVYRQTADTSGFYREKTGDFGRWVPGTADCGPGDPTKNNTVPLARAVYLGSALPAAQIVSEPTIIERIPFQF